MKLGIVTDSTCDLPPDLVEQHGIEVVPAVMVVDGVQLADGQGMSRQEFYRRLPGFVRPPTTAAPSIGEFKARYLRMFDQGCSNVISVHAAGALTAMVGT